MTLKCRMLLKVVTCWQTAHRGFVEWILFAYNDALEKASEVFIFVAFTCKELLFGVWDQNFIRFFAFTSFGGLLKIPSFYS